MDVIEQVRDYPYDAFVSREWTSDEYCCPLEWVLRKKGEQSRDLVKVAEVLGKPLGWVLGFLGVIDSVIYGIDPEPDTARQDAYNEGLEEGKRFVKWAFANGYSFVVS